MDESRFEHEFIAKMEEAFDGWKAVQTIEEMSIRDAYECGFRHGVEAAIPSEETDEMIWPDAC